MKNHIITRKLNAELQPARTFSWGIAAWYKTHRYPIYSEVQLMIRGDMGLPQNVALHLYPALPVCSSRKFSNDELKYWERYRSGSYAVWYWNLLDPPTRLRYIGVMG